MKKICLTLLIVTTVAFVQKANAQCYSCYGSNTGTYANAMGYNNSAMGSYSTALGNSNVISQAAPGAFATGINNNLTGGYSVAIGGYLSATGTGSMVIGRATPTYQLSNPYGNTLMVGFSSDVPTFFVGCSNGIGTTGRVGIGNTGLPTAKLHIKADEGEEAAAFIEPYDWGSGNAGGLAIGNMFHGITAINNVGLQFHTQLYYTFNDGNVGINTLKPSHNLHIEGSLFTKQFTLYNEHNIPKTGFVLISDEDGNGFWEDPSSFGLWKVNPNIETDIYYSTGSVGIGTINTFGYSLAVAGKILTDEVMVKHYDTWPDFVFEADYKLMPLLEVESFVNKNKHLPDVKSSVEVGEDGIGLAEMNRILLQKVEELTLYLIEQKKELNNQEIRVNSLQKEIDHLLEVINDK